MMRGHHSHKGGTIFDSNPENPACPVKYEVHLTGVDPVWKI
jgi:hypothetical protein